MVYAVALCCSCEDYTADLSNITAHLTNQYVQKKHAEYQNRKDDTVWSMSRLNDYINDHVAAAKVHLLLSTAKLGQGVRNLPLQVSLSVA